MVEYSEDFVKKLEDIKNDFKENKTFAPKGFWAIVFERGGYEIPVNPGAKAHDLANKGILLLARKNKREKLMRELLDKYFPLKKEVEF